MHVTLVKCTLRLMGEAVKSLGVLSGVNVSKYVARTCMMKKVVVQDLRKPMKMLKKCGIWYIQIVFKH
jgi:hypothetical protein